MSPVILLIVITCPLSERCLVLVAVAENSLNLSAMFRNISPVSAPVLRYWAGLQEHRGRIHILSPVLDHWIPRAGCQQQREGEGGQRTHRWPAPGVRHRSVHGLSSLSSGGLVAPRQ